MNRLYGSMLVAFNCIRTNICWTLFTFSFTTLVLNKDFTTMRTPSPREKRLLQEFVSC